MYVYYYYFPNKILKILFAVQFKCPDRDCPHFHSLHFIQVLRI